MSYGGSDIIEAAARALQRESDYVLSNETAQRIATAVIAAVTPLIKADALERAAQLTEKYRAGAYEARQRIAAAIRAFKEPCL